MWAGGPTSANLLGSLSSRVSVSARQACPLLALSDPCLQHTGHVSRGRLASGLGGCEGMPCMGEVGPVHLGVPG